MWLLFALIGLLLGETSGGLAGALLGGLLGYLLGRVNRLEARLRSLEAGRGDVPAVRASSPAVEAPAAIAPAAAVPDPAPVPATVTVPGIAPAPDRSTPPWLGAPPRLAMPTELLGRLLSGNILAKLGMVLLFFGIASALKLAADYGMLPPYLRLLAAALAGLASLWAGAAPATGQAFRPAWLYRFAPESEQARRGFGFALEGGGFGILYIATWFALAQFGYLGTATAFLIFAGLGAACLAMAARQDSQSFALLGVLGGFLAPLLVPGQGEPRILFAYLALLDLYILALSLHRAWRLVIVTSLAFSVGVGYAWADLNYAAALRVDVESFVLVLFLLYSATPWLAARRGPPPQWGWQSGVLLFGPPAAAAATQSALYYGDLDFLALSSLGAGLWYALLQRLTRPTGAMLVRQAQAGLALAFLSLAPWLAFSQNVAGVFWALEGAGVVWYASRSGTRLPLLAGSLLQALSGLLLLDLWWQGPDGLPFRDSLFHASLLLVAAGALSAYAVRAQAFRHRAFLVWALVWWFGAFLAEFERLFDPARTWVAMAALATLSSAGLEWLGRRHGLADLRRAALLLLPVLALALANAYLVTGHPLAHGLWLVGAAALAVHYRGLYRQAGDGLTWWLRERHVAAYWLAAWALAWEAAWLAEPAFGASTAEAARAAVLAGTLLLVCRGATVWPFAGALRPLYLDTALALPALLGWLWLFAMPTGLTGAWALPYLPLVNPLEAAAALLLWALYGHWLAAARFGPRLAYPALFGLAALFWFSQMLARTVHHWAGVPFLAGPLWHSALLQALLSLGWTAFALFAMVAASRRQIRPLWFAGLGLLLLVCAKLAVVDLANVAGLLRVLSLLGVGLLVLGAGYLAPVPPRQAEPAPPAG
ncbi:DUF2339 domain-containing protein [Parasulfuritortus cantonensis]|uniref:DUF2339 domain-containing protein n=1 Tax=Parasulfuritortus cantonensis TaxID=2528202 RepID=A0A4R1BA93_9PROT|nr:DUF2339 domain-containing protein [Parasulfuritortus cantonensis]TCJ13859.1 DUF2339 domain-containing protein [Parasulfuritortus cantonensis]